LAKQQEVVLTAKTDKNRYNLQNVQRVAWILKAFSEHGGPLSLADLARATEINKTTIFRIMTTFADEGFFVFDPETKKYRVGCEFSRLSAGLAGNASLIEVARPHMNNLRDEVNETVAMYVRQDTDKLSVAISEGTYPVRRTVILGERTPLHCSAGGKVLLAFEPDDVRDDLLSRLAYERFTEHTVTDRATLEKQLAEVRATGYAVSSEERYLGALSIAAPVVLIDGRLVAAINILSPVFRVKDFEGFAQLLTETARRISRALPAGFNY
jgi:IclR family KDG regulon transcriptional repressor